MSLFETTKYNTFELLLPGGRVRSFQFTPGNGESIDKARRAKDNARREYETAAEQTAGRPITSTEWANGRIKSATDSRDFARKMRDEKFSAKPKDARTTVEKEIERQQAKVEAEEYRSLTKDQQRLRDLQNYQANQEAEADAKMSHGERRAKYGETLARLKARQDHLRWRTDTDESEWLLVEQSIQLIETSGSDLRALPPRLEEFNRLDATRRLNRQAGIQQRQAMLLSEAKALEEEDPAPFLDPEAQTEEPKPQPVAQPPVDNVYSRYASIDPTAARLAEESMS